MTYDPIFFFNYDACCLLSFNFSWFRGKNCIIKFEGSFKSGNSDCFVLEHVEHERPEVTVEIVCNLNFPSCEKITVFGFRTFTFQPLLILSWFAHKTPSFLSSSSMMKLILASQFLVSGKKIDICGKWIYLLAILYCNVVCNENTTMCRFWKKKLIYVSFSGMGFACSRHLRACTKR